MFEHLGSFIAEAIEIEEEKDRWMESEMETKREKEGGEREMNQTMIKTRRSGVLYEVRKEDKGQKEE